MFGYAPRPVGGGLFASYASLEKALVDLLYLYPAYRSESDLVDLRLDEEVLRRNGFHRRPTTAFWRPNAASATSRN